MPSAAFGVQVLPPDAGAGRHPGDDTDERAFDELQPGERCTVDADQFQSPRFHAERAMLQTPRNREIADRKRKVVGQIRDVSDTVIGCYRIAVDQNRWKARQQTNGEHGEQVVDERAGAPKERGFGG